MRIASLGLVGVLALACGGGAATPSSSASPVTPEPARTSTNITDREVFIAFLHDVFRESYAPLDLKQQHGWNLDEAIAELQVAARDPKIDQARFQRLLYHFFRSPNDIHTNIMFDAQGAVWLGMHFTKTESGYRIAWVDRSIHPDEPQLGDEVLRFDGVPIEQAVRAVGHETAWRSTPAFEQAFAEWFTTLRGASEWGSFPDPGDVVELELQRGGQPRTVRVPWRDVREDGAVARCPYWGRSLAGYVPELGSIRWRNEDAVHVPSYVFEAGGRRYGYVRLWTYGFQGQAAGQAMEEFDEAVDAFLAQRVKAVVIDQTGNGGGNFGIGLSMLSRLSAAPRIGPTQRFRYLGDGVAGFYDRAMFEGLAAHLGSIDSDEAAASAFQTNPMLSDLLGFLPPTIETISELRAFLSFVANPPPGETPLTPPHYQMVERYRLDPARGRAFTGPLLLLIDERNISAAEYTAAALRDNGGVTLFGTTTSGAGGDQRTYERDRLCERSPNGDAPPRDPLSPCVPAGVADVMGRLGVRGMSVTITLGYRVNADGELGELIENRGVAPHVPYHITSEDLTSSMAPMRAAILDTLIDLP